MERFEKVKNLGRGAQGTVILVRRKIDGSYFVIKRILVEDVDKSEQTDFTTEIAVLSSVSHPNIIGYHGSFIEDGVMNVVMEYADNGSLFQHVQRARAPSSEDIIVSFFVQLVLALKHLHNRKILHRDIKTKNVFVTKQHRVKLGDFGLSKMLDASASFAHTAVGTPYYLSPELCEGKAYNYKSDIWALGCLLYELCTFKHAFDATSLPALVMSIIRGEVEPIRQPYSAPLLRVIHECLSKDPERRPSVDDLLRLDFVQGELQRQMHLIEADVASSSAVERPLFTAGHVETVLSQMRSVRSPNRSDSEASEFFSNDRILSELEEEEEFIRLLQTLRGQLEVKDRVTNRMPLFKCFVGKELVDYLVNELCMDSRPTAVLVGQRWLDAGVFYHVSRSEPFSDSEALFRFGQDEITTLLNMKAVASGPAQGVDVVVRNLQGAMHACVSGYTVEDGVMVDYESLATSDAFKAWCSYATELQRVQLQPMSYNAKIALIINLYNMLLVHGFIAIGPPMTHQQRMHFWNHTAYAISGMVFSLQDIHHGVLRANRKPPHAYLRVFSVRDERARLAAVVWDPRIHFALNHGTKGSPRLRVFTPEGLDAQLDNAVRAYLGRTVEVQALGPVNPLRAEGGLKVTLPAVFETFKEDFGGDEATVLRWVAQYVPQKDQILECVGSSSIRIAYRELDATINKVVRPVPPGSAPGSVRRAFRARKTGGEQGSGPVPRVRGDGSRGSSEEISRGLGALNVS